MVGNEESVLRVPKCISIFAVSRKEFIWTASSEFGTYRLCEQRRFRRACASAQSCQNLRCSLIQAVSQEEPSDRKPALWPLWMAGHAQLKFVTTECSKTQIRLTGLIWKRFSCTPNRNFCTTDQCKEIWAMSLENLLGFPTRWDSNRAAQLQKLGGGLKFWTKKLEVLYYLGSEQQRCWSDFADAQADLRLCCSHRAKTSFLKTRLILSYRWGVRDTSCVAILDLFWWSDISFWHFLPVFWHHQSQYTLNRQFLSYKYKYVSTID